jgi:WD40 repeat protein/serine/threonine protein kinase
MNRQTVCPDTARLQELLDNCLPDDEQSDLVRHLDSCTGCQHSLEALACGGSSCPEAVRHVDEVRPPSDSAFWPALRQLESEANTLTLPVQPPPDTSIPEAAPDLSLDFLSPADQPNFLGRVGHFNIVGVVGRGGMGVVLKALDVCLQRFVAIKVLDPQYANSETARRRFCREARAAAKVTHENLVAIHQVDEDEEKELPYLVMQLVSGASLQDRLDSSGPLPVREIVRIGMQTAAGLAAAHAEGLIHRDVKPANILLEEPLGNVRLTDFGLARAAEDVRLTQTGFVTGTPLYMSPEQARGEAVDHRADLFSLGSVMYAMCTGQPPFDGNSAFIVLKKVTEEPPRPIREVNPEVPEWLVEIIDRLLAKKPEERFQSAAEVAELLAGQLATMPPATPGPVSRVSTNRSSQTAPRSGAQRGWGFGTITGFVFLAALVGLLSAEVVGFTHFITPYVRPGGPKPNGPGDEATTLARATFNGDGGPVWSVAFAPDGNTMAMAIDDGTVKLWDLTTREVRAKIAAHKGPVWSVAFSPDGTSLATASDDRTARLWDVTTGEERRALLHPDAVRCLAFSRDGKTLVTGSRDGKVRIWDTSGDDEPVVTAGHPHVVMSVAVSADGKTVVSAGGDKTVKLWDAATGREKNTLQGHTGGIYSVALAPGGKVLASGGWDKTIRLWEVGSGNRLPVCEGHSQDVWGVAFSPDGRLLASASEDRTVKLWETASGKERATFRGHASTVYAVAFSPDGRTLASGSRDGTVKWWDVEGPGGPAP